MNKELLEKLIAVISAGFDADNDVYGILHNTAVDVLSEIEALLDNLK